MNVSTISIFDRMIGSIIIVLAVTCGAASAQDATVPSACMTSPCVHGQCQELNHGSSYTCKCDEGYRGTHCDRDFEHAFCTHNGYFYAQDQKWDIGCSQTCVCTDADPGFYSCHNPCLNWNRLPSVCHLDDPPPGKCCKQPTCPASSGIIIQVNTAFKDEYPITSTHEYVYVSPTDGFVG